MALGQTEFPIRNFLGVNLKDAAERVRDNELTQAQNLYQASKGVLANRWGSVIDQSVIPMCSRISGLWRHHLANGERFTIYHCVPDSTVLPDNSTDLTLTDVTSTAGTIFGGGSVAKLYVCYSWIGRGMEQTYNTRTRAGFSGLTFPLTASNNTSHQSITLGGTGHLLQVTVPAFPTGITGANIFVARGTATEMTYMGTVTTSGGSLTVANYIGPVAAVDDTVELSTSIPVSGYTDASGLLAPGTYYIATGWVTDPDQEEGSGPQAPVFVPLQSGISPSVTGLTPSSAVPAVIHAGSGSLSDSTEYDFKLALIDTRTGDVLYVTDIFSGTTGGDDTTNNLAFTTPNIPSWASSSGGPTATWTVYFGSHGGTLYLANWFPDPPDASTGAYGTAALAQGIAGGVSFLQILPPYSANPTAPGSMLPAPGQPFYQMITLTTGQNAIQVTGPAEASTNGAKACYVFIGTQDPTRHPMTCVGIVGVGNDAALYNYLDIKSIPSHNAQSTPAMNTADVGQPMFWHQVNDGYIGGINYAVNPSLPVAARFGFLVASKNGGALQEVFPSRTNLYVSWIFSSNPGSVYAGGSTGSLQGQTLQDFPAFFPNPKTQNDLYKYASAAGFTQPFAWPYTVNDPVFAFLNGISYFANGIDLGWQTDGYTLGQMSCIQGPSPGNGIASGTLLPPVFSYISVFDAALVVGGALCGNLLYGCNANAPQNWAVGGAGTAQIFVAIGDSTGSGLTAIGVFTPENAAPQNSSDGGTNNPSSYLLSFKKVGIWMVNEINPPTSTTLAGVLSGQQPQVEIQTSGLVGCVANRSVQVTPIGTAFMGSDANIYLIKAIQQPIKIGTKIQNGLLHLVGNDAAMRACTAVYHDSHYKLSYPSPAAVAAGAPYVNDSEWWADLRTQDGDPITWVGPHAGRNIGPQIVLGGDNDNLTRLVADAALVRTYTADSISTLTDLDSSGNPKTVVLQARGKIHRFSTEAHLKRFFGAMIDAYFDTGFNNTVLLEFFADANYSDVNRTFSTGGAVWNSSDWDESLYSDQLWEGYSMLLPPPNLVGRTLQWRLTKSDQAPFVLAAITLFMATEARRYVH